MLRQLLKRALRKNRGIIELKTLEEGRHAGEHRPAYPAALGGAEKSARSKFAVTVG